MNKNGIIILLLISSCFVNAQKSFPEFGNYNTEELSLTQCSFDKNSDAIVLLDEANSSYDDSYKLITYRRIRIKIFSERAIDRGDIRIRFYSKDGFELIKSISAQSYTPDGAGNWKVSAVDKKSIFTEKEDNIFSSVKFAIPNVKPGSIIEYKYQSIMKSYAGLQDWVFQSDIPTLRSCYNLEVLPTTEFSYFVQRNSAYPIIIQPQESEGKIYFEMDNLPGLRFEPFMDAPKDYLQKIDFQLAGYLNTFGDMQSVNETWKDIAFNLSSDDAFSGGFKKDYSGLDELKMLVLPKTSASEKIATVYEYVKKMFTWNGYNGKYTNDGLKNVWEKRTGHAGEINLLLTNLLQIFDIEAYPMLVAERDFGKVDTVHPILDNFNKTAAYALADGKVFILDATEKYNPAGLTPFSLLNTHAFIVDKKKFGLIKIMSSTEKYDDMVFVKAKLSASGELTGSAEFNSIQYAQAMKTEQIKKDEKKFIKEKLVTPHEGMSIDSFQTGNIDNPREPLMQRIKFHSDMSENGGFILLNYNLFTGLSKNPFTSAIRFTNINFGYPYNVEVNEEIELPAGATLDNPPKNRSYSTAEKDISISREIRKEGNILKVRLLFKQSGTLYHYSSYPAVKQFYNYMSEMLNEPVVVKLPK